MKASTARLFSMLPRVLIIKALVTPDTKAISIVDMTDGAGKREHGLDHTYPGFEECLSRLVQTGHVVDAGTITLERVPSNGHPTYAVARFFISLRPTDTLKGQST